MRGGWLNWMILRVFSNFGDSVSLLKKCKDAGQGQEKELVMLQHK